jgi:hypothetical protein
MRPFEWGVCLAFVPILLLPFIQQGWRRGWSRVFAPLPVLASVL